MHGNTLKNKKGKSRTAFGYSIVWCINSEKTPLQVTLKFHGVSPSVCNIKSYGNGLCGEFGVSDDVLDVIVLSIQQRIGGFVYGTSLLLNLVQQRRRFKWWV